ncbi:hypothetical protein [Gemella sanguinis]|uniref:hypothetical protein n=1 Tax=Gemella sanguinis TaxID=84135 RepID=UPI00080760A9|nr:hypothetical protein [Gemella sanguinis]
MKKFNIFIIIYCLLLILVYIVNSIIEYKTEYTISAVYSTYMIYLVIGAVLLIIVRIIIQLCLIKDNSSASIFIRGIVVIFLIFVGLLTTVFPALLEEKVYFETVNNTEYVVVERGFMVESRRYYHKKKDKFLMEKRVSYVRKISEKSPEGEKEDYLK